MDEVYEFLCGIKFDKIGGLCYYFSIICSFQFNREINALYESMIFVDWIEWMI